jgi:antitoxin HicB
MSMRYPVELATDDNGTVLVVAPDFPEAATFGDDEADALRRAVDAIETAIQGRMIDREPIPEPRPPGETYVALPAQTALKIALYRAMLAEGLRKADLVRLLDWHAPQVDRLFDLRHASRLESLESAFKALGRDIKFQVDKAA